MKTTEKRGVQISQERTSLPKASSCSPVTKKAAAPAFEERQITEMKRTFTDRWEW